MKLIQFNAGLLRKPVEQWAEWYFDRPATGAGPNSALFDSESDFLEADDLPDGASPELVILERLAELHERYEDWTTTYSADQLSQGLWAMFSFPGFLGEVLLSGELPLGPRARLMRSLVVQYRVYVKGWDPNAAMPHGWEMLWDLILGNKHAGDLADLALECLGEILAMDDVRCQGAALHGLNHLNHPKRPAMVQRWIDQHRGNGWNLGWLEACRDGRAM